MAFLKITKTKTIERLSSQINKGKELLKKITGNLSMQEYSALLLEYKAWSKSSAAALRQLFSDNYLAEEFLVTENAGQSQENLPGKITQLEHELNSSLDKLEDIHKDVAKDFYAITEHADVKVARISLWGSITIAVITAVAGIVTGYLAYHKDDNPLKVQGLADLELQGKWKYICTSFDGSYQHGGRFTVQKDKDGMLFLAGERMWRDTKDTINNTWKNITFKEGDYLQWHTNWIFVYRNSRMNFEYEIPMQSNNVLGYCSGQLTATGDTVQYVKGNFYVLNVTPLLTGQIIFKRVSDQMYESETTLPKNH